MELFSPDWMVRYMALWNSEKELYLALEKVQFSANIAYGFLDNDTPASIIQIKHGHAYYADSYTLAQQQYPNLTLDWDLRASPQNWLVWISRELGMMGLGLAVSTKKLQFYQGDYQTIIQNPLLISAFVKSFNIMRNI